MRLFQDHVEHRGEIAGRGIDDTQHLGGRGLLLQGLAQVAVESFQLAEEAHVLKGDGGLVGEGLDEIDLGGGEGLDLASATANHTDRSTVSEDRYRDE